MSYKTPTDDSVKMIIPSNNGNAKLNNLSQSSAKVKLPNSYYDPKHKGWGFLYWGTLHTIADSFPEVPSADDCAFITQFFHLTLPRLLPCPNCTVHLVESVKPGGSVGPVNCVSGTELTKWVNKLENSVRMREGKEQLTDQDYQREYDLIRSVKWSAVLKDLKQNWSTVCNTSTTAGSGIDGTISTIDNADKRNACSHIEVPQDFRRISNVFSSPASAVADARNSAEKNVLIMFVICILGLALIMALVTCMTLFLKQSRFDRPDNKMSVPTASCGAMSSMTGTRW